MTNTAICIEEITKKYNLGVIGTGSLVKDFERWWAKVRKQPDPYSRIGQQDAIKKYGETILALNGVSFSVDQGEALGIIGRNGAGKSTLLKILSRVTAPTTGLVKVKGRIGSLLEVGTGFHPELTGRENVYLNGAILGMKKAEVSRKFDEIVDFSGVEKFIDTPVKRYSSGMYVRLAFAVAAHLEPEILIVDEVLAVGDAEFQKKCLGKMSDVVGGGRTVLFVSHNMQAIQNLCGRTLVLEDGRLSFDGPSSEAIAYYLKNLLNPVTNIEWADENAPGNRHVKLLGARVNNEGQNENNNILYTNEDINLELVFQNLKDGETVLDLTIHLQDERNNVVFVTSTARLNSNCLQPGVYCASCTIPKNLLNQGTYTISRLLFVKDRGQILFEHNNTLTFDVVFPPTSQLGWMGRKQGIVNPLLEWKLSPYDHEKHDFGV